MGWSRQFIEKVRMRQTLPLSLATSVTLKSGRKGQIKLSTSNHNEKPHPATYKIFQMLWLRGRGDSFKFIEVIEDCDFNEAVLADRAGIIPSNDDWIGGGAGEDKRKDLLKQQL